MGLLNHKKTGVLLILISILVTVFIQGVFANTHTSSAVVTPNIVPYSTNVDFEVTVTCESGQPIQEFRIYEQDEFENLICDSVSGWYGPYLGENEIGKYCQWNAQSAYKIYPGESEVFTYSADTPDTECCRTWLMETRDPDNYYVAIHPDICIDTTPPETTKSFSPEGTYRISEIEESTVEWVDTATIITLDATDSLGPHDAGIKEINWRNILLEGEEACWSEARCQVINVGDEEWNEEINQGNEKDFSINIEKDTESCHLLEFYSVDNTGNEETIKRNCFFVDKTPPEISKEVGTPKVPLCDLEESEAEEVYIEEDFSKDTFGVTMTKDADEDNVYWEIDLDGEDIPGHWSTGAQVIIANGVEPLFTLGWSPGESTSAPIYKPYSSGWGSATTTLPAGMSVSGNYNEEHYLITIPKTYLDGCPYYWAANVEATWTGHSSSVQENYPADWTRWTATNTQAGGSGNNWWISSSTSIDLNCEDVGPHPSDDVTLFWKWNLDDGPFNEDNYQGENYQLFFGDDSNHELEFWCVDAVGKESEHDIETFKVDSTPPEITKTMLGDEGIDWMGVCPPEDEGDECYVADNGKGGVSVSVEDPDPTEEGCNIGVDTERCNYGLWWHTTEEECEEEYPDAQYDSGRCLVEEGSIDEQKQILFHEDSTHDLVIYCYDKLGNLAHDEETFLVDSTPPETNKTYKDPTYVEGDYRWINSSTLINLSAKDEKVGTDETYYRITLLGDVDDEDCIETCEYTGGDLPFTTYENEFSIPEQSCHLIEFYSTDLLGNTEPVNKQCVFVDNAGPIADKRIGSPYENISGTNYITQDTPIVITCTDQTPHPVDHSSLMYRYKFADDCNDLNTVEFREWITKQEGQTEIKFTEDSCHEVEYYCVDALGNVGKTYDEIDVVDTQAPIITTTFNGPLYNNGTDNFIDTVSNITVNSFDPEPHPSGDVLCNYFVSISCECDFSLVESSSSSSGGGGCGCGGGTGNIDPLSPPFTITFPEESHHTLTVTCWDALGNTNQTSQDFYVDHTPPEILKSYGEPHWPIEINFEEPHWITSDTPIQINVDDNVGAHPTGIKDVEYRVTQVNDSFCYDEKLCDAEAQGSGDWVAVDPNNFDEFDFKIPEDSCHLIEVMAKDNVDKTATHKQCVFVDNKAPEPNKTVGEIKTMWDGADGTFYPEETAHCWDGTENSIDCWKVTLNTPITLDCNDPEPHPVDHEKTCFMVGLDGDDATQEYCRVVEGNYDGETGYCCGFDAPYTFNFLEESEHNLKFYCEDALGNVGPIDEEKFKVFGRMFDIPLNKKWNLISVPFDPINQDPDAVFSEVKENIDTVWTYDGETGKWYSYKPGMEETNDLDEIQTGDGYWVLATDDDTLTVGGSLFKPGPFVPPSKKLVEGWNLIGYYGIDPEENSAYCSLYSLRNLNGGLLKPTNWNALVSYWEPDNPYQWNYLSLCDEIEAGKGYWIAMDAQDTYNPQTVCGDYNILGAICSIFD